MTFFLKRRFFSAQFEVFGGSSTGCFEMTKCKSCAVVVWLGSFCVFTYVARQGLGSMTATGQHFSCTLVQFKVPQKDSDTVITAHK